MRNTPSVVIALLISCGGKADSPPAPAPGSAKVEAGSAKPAGSGSAKVAPDPTACFEVDSANKLSKFVTSANDATICIAKSDYTDDKAPPVETCVTLEYASGAFKPSAAPRPAIAVTAFAIKTEGGKLSVCGEGKPCTELALPKAKSGPDGGEAQPWRAAARADGALVAVTGGGIASLLILDGKTGKKKKTVKVADECIEAPRFLGETIYVPTNVCAGPGGTGHLFDGDGKLLGKVPDVNVYGATPVPLEGTQYAFGDFNSAKVAIVDVATGKQVKLIDAPQPDECESCGVAGDASSWSTSGVVKRPDGKLVAIGGIIAILDPASGKPEKTFQFPVCKKK